MSEDGGKMGASDLRVQPFKEEHASEEGFSVDWTLEEELQAKRK